LRQIILETFIKNLVSLLVHSIAATTKTFWHPAEQYQQQPKTSNILQNSIIFMAMRMSSESSSLNHNLSNIYEEWQWWSLSLDKIKRLYK
jgi:hypothetical protein